MTIKHRRESVASRHGQAGQSLISMMVGLVISLITIAAMLVLYKTMVGVSNEASVAARRDGQVSTGLLAAQIELQSAGFGVDAGAVPLNSRLSISNNGKQVAWHYNDGVNRCAGLWVDGNGIYRLPPRDGCVDAATATWTSTQREPMALMPTNAAGNLITFSSDEEGRASLEGYTFKQKVASCLPYMQQDFSASLAAPVALRVQLSNADESEQLFTVCLPNLI